LGVCLGAGEVEGAGEGRAAAAAAGTGVGLLLRVGPERGDSAGRREWIESKAESVIMFFSRSDSSSWGRVLVGVGFGPEDDGVNLHS
jgi:hypothetical protein